MNTVITTIEITQEVIKAETISTLECPGLTKFHRDGNSTKQVNFAIQKLFEGYIVKVEDHASLELNFPITKAFANAELFNRILFRLEIEHNLKQLILEDKIVIDTDKLEIELV